MAYGGAARPRSHPLQTEQCAWSICAANALASTRGLGTVVTPIGNSILERTKPTNFRLHHSALCCSARASIKPSKSICTTKNKVLASCVDIPCIIAPSISPGRNGYADIGNRHREYRFGVNRVFIRSSRNAPCSRRTAEPDGFLRQLPNNTINQNMRGAVR